MFLYWKLNVFGNNVDVELNHDIFSVTEFIIMSFHWVPSFKTATHFMSVKVLSRVQPVSQSHSYNDYLTPI